MRKLNLSMQITIMISLSLSVFNYSAAQTTTIEVSGNITSDTTWTADTVKVTGNVTVHEGATLTIDPGTYIEFQGWYYLIVHGGLLAIGDVNDTIIFTINDTTGFSNPDTTSGGHNRIWIQNAIDTSKLICCRIEYGKALGNVHSGEVQGGGINIEGSSNTIISRCNIYHNFASGMGGGVVINWSNIVFTHNLVHNNTGNLGGGVALGSGGYSLISNNIIKNNTSVSEGGGIWEGISGSIISGNIITKNTSIGDGGGIFTGGGSCTIDKNIISNNYSAGTWGGGGIASQEDDNTVSCNLIVNNSAFISGGGCIFLASNTIFLNNIVCNNSSQGNGGMAFFYYINSDFMNNIIWGNVTTGSGSPEPLQIWIQDPAANPNFYHCIIQGGNTGFLYFPGIQYTGDTISIINIDPVFTNPTAGPGLDYDGVSADWSFNIPSPCLNGGTDEAIEFLPTSTDFAGDQRVIHGRIDIGAYEKRISKDTATGIISEDTEWIADTLVITGDVTVTDSATLTITAGTYVEFQDYYKMIVEGTILAVGTEKDPIRFTVKDTTGFTNDTIFDGGWYGIAFDNSVDGANGRMTDNDTSKLIHCIIEYAKEFEYFKVYTGDHLEGGAIKARYFSNLLIKNCSIRYNSADNGAGIALTVGSSPVIEGNIIYKNSVNYSGGGILCHGRSEPKIINNIISNNIAYNSSGGGIACGSSNPVIQNNVICNNESFIDAGGIQINNSYPLISNNTVCNNKSGPDGGGAGLFVSSGNPLIYNTIFWGNVRGTDTLQVISWWPGDYYYCNIQGGRQYVSWGEWYEGTLPGLVESDPQFVSPSLGAGIEYDGLSANWSFTEFSPNINAGNPDLSELDLPSTDLDGNPRINHGVVDIGAYESQANPLEIIRQPVNLSKCEGDSISFVVETNGLAHYQWFKNQEPVPGANDPILIIDSVALEDEANYECVVENGYGPVSSNNVFLVVKAHPKILIEPKSQWVDMNKPVNLRISVDGTAPMSYQWMKDGTQLENGNLPEFNLDAPAYDDEGIYTCIISNACNEVVSHPATLYLAPQLCMVTVDQSTGSNLVVWEKKSIAPIDYYKIYRESKYAGIYDLLTTVPYNNLSVFLDLTADPKSRAYLYKITAMDSSGTETPIDLCKTHKTIHLLVTKNPETMATQLEWDHYVGFEYGTYIIYRSDTNYNFTEIDQMASSTSSWADLDPGVYYYRVAAVKPDTCYPSGNSSIKYDAGPYSYSISNVENNRLQNVGEEELLLAEMLKTYPNPFDESATILFNNPGNDPYTLYITDLSGKLCRLVNDITTSEYVLERKDLETGMYFIELLGPRTYRGKIIIE